MAAWLARPSSIAFLLAAAFQLLAGLPVTGERGVSVYLPEHIAEFALQDTVWQRQLYQIVLALALAATALTFLVHRFGQSRRESLAPPRPLSRLMQNTALAALVLFGLVGQGGVSALPLFGLAGIVVLFGAIGLARLPRRFEAVLRRALAAACVAAVLLLIVPGLYRPVVLPSAANVIAASAHYAGLLGPATKLALGTPFDRIRLNYGGVPILAWLFPVADLTRFRGLFDEILVWQILFLAGLMACARLYDRSKDWLLPAFVVVLVAPFVSTYYRSMYSPSQSGIRYVGFLFGLLLLRIGAGPGTGSMLGVAASALIFYNPETGIPVCLGLAFRQIVAGLSMRRRVFDAVGYCAAFLSGLGFGLASLGVLIFGIAGAKPAYFSPYLATFSSGYGGLRFRPEPWSFLMMACGIAAMIEAAARAAQGRLTPAQARRVAIAVTLLAWLPYYVNRTDPWNLWGLVLLLLFAAADWISFRRWRAAVGRLLRGRVTLASAIVLGVAVPIAVQNVVDTASALFRTWPSDLSVFSGALIPAGMQAELETKTAEVRALSAQGKLVYLTIDPSFVALGSGIDSGLAEGDVFSDTARPEDLQQLRDEVLQRNPDLILFDSPDGVDAQAFPKRVHLLARLQVDLSEAYVADRRTAGWDIWVRRPRPSGAASG